MVYGSCKNVLMASNNKAGTRSALVTKEQDKIEVSNQLEEAKLNQLMDNLDENINDDNMDVEFDDDDDEEESPQMKELNRKILANP